MFVSIDFLGPKKLILLLPQYLPEHPVDPYKLFPGICFVRYYEKK